MTGVPYETDDPSWIMAKAVLAAATADPDGLRMALRLSWLLEPAQSVFADPELTQRVFWLGAAAPRYPWPGPTRAEVLEVIAV